MSRESRRNQSTGSGLRPEFGSLEGLNNTEPQRPLSRPTPPGEPEFGSVPAENRPPASPEPQVRPLEGEIVPEVPPVGPPSTRRRKRSGGMGARRLMYWIIGLVIVMIPIMALVLMVTLALSARSIAEDPTEAVNDYLDLLMDGELESAHAMLCSEVDMPYATFLEKVAPSQQMTSYRMSGFRNYEGETAKVSGLIKFESGPQAINFRVKLEDEVWHVCDTAPYGSANESIVLEGR